MMMNNNPPPPGYHFQGEPPSNFTPNTHNVRPSQQFQFHLNPERPPPCYQVCCSNNSNKIRMMEVIDSGHPSGHSPSSPPPLYSNAMFDSIVPADPDLSVGFCQSRQKLPVWNRDQPPHVLFQKGDNINLWPRQSLSPYEPWIPYDATRNRSSSDASASNNDKLMLNAKTTNKSSYNINSRTTSGPSSYRYAVFKNSATHREAWNNNRYVDEHGQQLFNKNHHSPPPSEYAWSSWFSSLPRQDDEIKDNNVPDPTQQKTVTVEVEHHRDNFIETSKSVMSNNFQRETAINECVYPVSEPGIVSPVIADNQTRRKYSSQYSHSFPSSPDELFSGSSEARNYLASNSNLCGVLNSPYEPNSFQSSVQPGKSSSSHDQIQNVNTWAKYSNVVSNIVGPSINNGPRNFPTKKSPNSFSINRDKKFPRHHTTESSSFHDNHIKSRYCPDGSMSKADSYCRSHDDVHNVLDGLGPKMNNYSENMIKSEKPIDDSIAKTHLNLSARRYSFDFSTRVGYTNKRKGRSLSTGNELAKTHTKNNSDYKTEEVQSSSLDSLKETDVYHEESLKNLRQEVETIDSFISALENEGSSPSTYTSKAESNLDEMAFIYNVSEYYKNIPDSFKLQCFYPQNSNETGEPIAKYVSGIDSLNTKQKTPESILKRSNIDLDSDAESENNNDAFYDNNNVVDTISNINDIPHSVSASNKFTESYEAAEDDSEQVLSTYDNDVAGGYYNVYQNDHSDHEEEFLQEEDDLKKVCKKSNNTEDQSYKVECNHESVSESQIYINKNDMKIFSDNNTKDCESNNLDHATNAAKT